MTNEEKFNQIDQFSSLMQISQNLKWIKEIIDKAFKFRDSSNWETYGDLQKYYESILYDIQGLVEEILDD